MSKNRPEQPKDTPGGPIPVLGPFHDDTQVVNLTDSTAKTLTIPTGTQIYELASEIDIHFDADGTAAVATSALFPRGVGVYKVIPGQTAISVIRVGGSAVGVVTLTPLG